MPGVFVLVRMGGMKQLALKNLLIGIGITSVGLGMITFAMRWQLTRSSRWERMQLALVCGGALFVGGGVLYPFMARARK